MQPTPAYQLLRRRGCSPAEFAQSGLNAPKVVDAPTRRTPLCDSAQCESAAAAIGVETPAILEVAVSELGVLAYRAEDSKCIGRAERHGLLRRVRLPGPERKAFGGPKHRPNVYPCSGWTASDPLIGPDEESAPGACPNADPSGVSAPGGSSGSSSQKSVGKAQGC